MKNKKIFLIAIIMVLILFICSCLLLYSFKINKVVTTITLDINPSIEIGLNYKKEVVKIVGLNQDGKEILKNENFKGDELDDAIEEIAELVILKGYITKENNYILVNVNDNNLKNEISTLVNKEFREENIECNVIIQDIAKSAKENALKYGISENKASYIEEIIKENNSITFEELKDKSVNEINKYIENKNEEVKKEEVDKKENNTQNTTTNNNNNISSNSNNTNNKPNKKPIATPPQSNDRTGAWCEFYKTIPPEGGVEYETPGYINDLSLYVEAAKKIMPEDASWSSYYQSITEYKTASYCSAGIVELENYDKTKTYTAWLDSVTLELLEPIIVKELEKPNIDEAGAKVIVSKWLLDTYEIDINNCDWENYYYAIDGSTKLPEWQYTCKIEETNTYYAVVVNAITGNLTNDRTWTN